MYALKDLDRTMHCKISTENFGLLRDRALKMSLSVSAYVRLLIQQHLGQDATIEITSHEAQPKRRRKKAVA